MLHVVDPPWLSWGTWGCSVPRNAGLVSPQAPGNGAISSKEWGQEEEQAARRHVNWACLEIWEVGTGCQDGAILYRTRSRWSSAWTRRTPEEGQTGSPPTSSSHEPHTSWDYVWQCLDEHPSNLLHRDGLSFAVTLLAEGVEDEMKLVSDVAQKFRSQKVSMGMKPGDRPKASCRDVHMHRWDVALVTTQSGTELLLEALGRKREVTLQHFLPNRLLDSTNDLKGSVANCGTLALAQMSSTPPSRVWDPGDQGRPPPCPSRHWHLHDNGIRSLMVKLVWCLPRASWDIKILNAPEPWSDWLQRCMAGTMRVLVFHDKLPRVAPHMCTAVPITCATILHCRRISIERAFSLDFLCSLASELSYWREPLVTFQEKSQMGKLA